MNDTDEAATTLTHVIYGLHALSILIGVLTSATIVGAFIFGLPSIVAVVLNYAKRSSVRGTWLDSHFRWQIRTFWVTFTIVVLVTLVFGPLSLILIGIPFLIGGYLAAGIWAAYRVARGWIALRDRQPMPLPSG